MLITTARFQLRDATAAYHRRVDTAFSAFDLTRADDYRRFLSAHVRVLPALEDMVAAGTPWSGWSPRASLLMADFQDMQTQPPAAMVLSLSTDAAARWGIQYVLEGSKLGGRVLASRVAQDLPRRYLASANDPQAWQRFQAELNEASIKSGSAWESAIVMAQHVFEIFEQAAIAELEGRA